MYLVGGGSFEQTGLSSHKECRKLVKKDGGFNFEVRAMMKYARNGHSVCAVGQTHLVVAGTRIGNGASSEIMDIKADKWSDLPDLNTGRYYHSSCSFNSSKVFLFCGIEQATKKYLDSIEFIDMQANNRKWENFEVNYGDKVCWPLISGR